jgi:hypothetical protein
MKNISDKSCRETRYIYLVFNNLFFFFENRAVYEIMWKKSVEGSRPQLTIWLIRIACWITQATNAHIDRAILITIPLQQWLHERASILRYT